MADNAMRAEATFFPFIFYLNLFTLPRSKDVAVDAQIEQVEGWNTSESVVIFSLNLFTLPRSNDVAVDAQNE